MGHVIEHWDSRAETDDEAEFVFNVINEPSVISAQQAVLLEAPAEYHGKYMGPMTITPTGPGMWQFKFRYIREKVDINFDFVAEKVKVMKSKETIANYNILDIAQYGTDGPDFGGLVNVTKDKVEGLEVYAKGSFKITMKWALPRDSYPSTYVDSVMRQTCLVNAYPLLLKYKKQIFYFDRGELVYIGGNYRDSGEGLGCEIQLNFEGRYNESDIKVGEMSGFFPDNITRLLGGMDAVVTSMIVTDSSGFPTPPFTVTIGTETMVVTGITGTTWTVTRGGSPTTHNDNDLVVNKGGPAPATSDYGTVSKEGWHYIWIRSSEKTQDFGDGRVKVEVPETAHIERFYDYNDFEFLQVFDVINEYEDDLVATLEAEQEEEEDEENELWVFDLN